MQRSVIFHQQCNRVAWLFFLFSAFPAFADSPPILPDRTIQVQAESEHWVDAQGKVQGVKMAILEGDPIKEGLFTIRLKVPAGYVLQPHWHPADERVTVLSGKVLVGFGDTIDAHTATPFGPGSFYVNPANAHHYVQFPVETIVQLTGIGPWKLTFIEQDKEK